MVFVLILFLFVVGTSYAVWQITLQQTEKNILTTGCFKIEFSDINPIHLEKAYPISDEEGKALVPYEFTITNTCNSFASYQINLEILNTTTLENLDYLKVMLGEDISLFKDNEVTTKTLENAKSARKLETGYLDKNQEKTFSLRLWLDENTPTSEEFMNKLFESKVTIVSSYVNEFDREDPVASFTITRNESEVIIDASSSTDNMKIKNYYYSLDGENYIKSKSSSYSFPVDNTISYGKATEAIHLLAKSSVSEIYVRVEDEFGNISSVYKETLGELAFDNTVDNNLRYIGANPNNYVNFNNELWRIIGVMNNIDDGTGKKEIRIKLIRNDSLGKYVWDVTPSSVNGGGGVNEWSTAKLNTLLNDFYLNSKLNQSCYTASYKTFSCSFANGLRDVQEYIDNVLWNTGSNDAQVHDRKNIIASNFYNSERSNNIGKQCTSGTYCTDKVLRTTSWIGRIGMIYPSDYGYATRGGNTTNRTQCLDTVLYSWNASSVSDCKNNNWLYKNNTYWTITPGGRFDCSYSSYGIWSDSKVEDINDNYLQAYVYPSLYLKSDIKIISGNGSELSPYRLSLD